jgi:hypothetical protein
MKRYPRAAKRELEKKWSGFDAEAWQQQQQQYKETSMMQQEKEQEWQEERRHLQVAQDVSPCVRSVADVCFSQAVAADALQRVQWFVDNQEKITSRDAEVLEDSFAK